MLLAMNAQGYSLWGATNNEIHIRATTGRTITALREKIGEEDSGKQDNCLNIVFGRYAVIYLHMKLRNHLSEQVCSRKYKRKNGRPIWTDINFNKENEE